MYRNVSNRSHWTPCRHQLILQSSQARLKCWTRWTKLMTAWWKILANVSPNYCTQKSLSCRQSSTTRLSYIASSPARHSVVLATKSMICLKWRKGQILTKRATRNFTSHTCFTLMHRGMALANHLRNSGTYLRSVPWIIGFVTGILPSGPIPELSRRKLWFKVKRRPLRRLSRKSLMLRWCKWRRC